MSTFLILIFFIGFLFLKFFQRNEHVALKKLKASLFYTENIDLLVAFSQRESTVKKASSVFLTLESLELAMESNTFASINNYDYQEMDYRTYIAMLDLFPSISGVLLFDTKNNQLIKTYITRDRFLKLVLD